ncbi:MAG: TetR family transcriptional regulator [Actinomycetota bacterium]|nr:TetR family transcriptional regulator [Actinomycetota bacterium]
MDLFATQGYAGTSTRQIAARMDFSVAALCYHFRFKEDLLSALVEPLLVQREEILSAFEAEAPLSLDRKRALLDTYLTLLLGNVELTRFVSQDATVRSHPTIGLRLDDGRRRFQDLLVGGEGDADDLLATAAIGAFCGPILQLDGFELEGMRGRLVAAALAVLQSGSSRPGSRAAGRGARRSRRLRPDASVR